MSTKFSDCIAKKAATQGPLASFHFMGTIEIETAIAFQTRLVYEAGGREDDRLEVLFVEHLPAVTIGRAGSRAQIRLTDAQLAREGLAAQWVGRGGGAVLHQPGQLAVYPIVPLERRCWSVGDYLSRFRRGLASALENLQIQATMPNDCLGLWGRTGQLVSLGIGVRNWITLHGAWLNVDVSPKLLQQVEASQQVSDSSSHNPRVSSLLAERQGRVTMTSVRSALVAALVTAFDCPRHHVHSGHPLFRPALRAARA